MHDKMNVEEAAKFLGVSTGTLRNWLWKKSGPRNYKFMGRVYFDKKDLEAFRRAMTEVRAS